MKLKYEYLLVFISIVWVAFFSYTIQLTPHFSSTGDDISYLFSSKLLYHDFKLDNTRPLLISVIHGLPYLFGLTNVIVIKWGLIINFLAWFFSATFLFKIISILSNRKKAFIISILYVLCIGNLAIAFNFLPESIFIFFIILAAYFLVKFHQTTKSHYLIYAITILILNTLIKPVSIGLAFILLLFYIKELITTTLKSKYSVLLFLSLILVFFQMYSMKKEYGDFTISYIGSVTYYNYLGDKADSYKKILNIHLELQKEIRNLINYQSMK